MSEGGEDTSVAAESNLLNAHGHTTKILFFDNADMGEGLWGKINAGISAIYNKSSALILKKEIQEFGPDLIHIHNFFFQASPAVIIEAKKHNIPVVVTIQNFRLLCTNALLLRNNKICELCINKTFAWYGIIYKCYNNSATQSAAVAGMAGIHKIAGTWRHSVDQYITPAEFIKAKLINSSLKLNPAKVVIKRNFVSDAGKAEGNKRANFFLFVGRISIEKGVNVLLNGFRNLPDDQLMIVGDGPHRERLMNEYGHLKNIQFAGKKDKAEVIALMKECKALIFPSIWYEGLPLTIIEAFSTGTPVIASKVGAMEEMVISKVNGLLFEAGSVSRLYEAISIFKGYIKDSNFALYEGARQSYLDYYHPDVCYETTINIYKNLVSSQKEKPIVTR